MKSDEFEESKSIQSPLTGDNNNIFSRPETMKQLIKKIKTIQLNQRISGNQNRKMKLEKIHIKVQKSINDNIVVVENLKEKQDIKLNNPSIPSQNSNSGSKIHSPYPIDQLIAKLDKIANQGNEDNSNQWITLRSTDNSTLFLISTEIIESTKKPNLLCVTPLTYYNNPFNLTSPGTINYMKKRLFVVQNDKKYLNRKMIYISEEPLINKSYSMDKKVVVQIPEEIKRTNLKNKRPSFDEENKEKEENSHKNQNNFELNVNALVAKLRNLINNNCDSSDSSFSNLTDKSDDSKFNLSIISSLNSYSSKCNSNSYATPVTNQNSVNQNNQKAFDLSSPSTIDSLIGKLFEMKNKEMIE